MKTIVLAMNLLALAGCLDWSIREPMGDGDGDGDVDGDADGDVDVGTDGDGDGDVDTETDGDACEPQCDRRSCGPDGCGGECPPGCDDEHWCYLGDCLEYGWTELFPEASPLPRLGAALACGSDHCYLFGGRLDDWESYDDTWIWDGVSWTFMDLSVSPPMGSSRSLVYDDSRDVFVLFVRDTDPVFVSETWEFNGENWEERSPGSQPEPRFGYSLAYDFERAVSVLYGGTDGAGAFEDTWEWDGVDWSDVSAPGPGPRAFAGVSARAV